MTRSRAITVTVIGAAVIAVLAWQVVDGLSKSIQISIADEQTKIFSEMVEKASDAIRREPPDLKAAVGYLKYAHNYYPSGTKQTVGSHLDRIVERARSNAERQMMEMLRVVTGVDLGTDVDTWSREFGTEAMAGPTGSPG